MNRSSRLGSLAAVAAVVALAGCPNNTAGADGGTGTTGGSAANNGTSGGSAANGGTSSGSAANGGSSGAGASTGASGGTSSGSASNGTSGGGSTGAASTGGSSGGSTGVSVSQACTDYATAICNLYVTCDNNWEPNEGTLADCIANTNQNCLLRLGLPTPPSGQTAALTEACSLALPTQSCVEQYGNSNVPACVPPAGTGAIGTPCAISGECASQYCAIGDNTVCATCQAMPVDGADCTNENCGQGQICLHTKKCAAPVLDGGACGGDEDCEYGFACLTASKGLKVCTPAEALGQPCDYKSLTGPLCEFRQGLFCRHVGDGGVCTQEGLADAGQTCGDNVADPLADAGLYTLCSLSGFCQKPQADAGQGTCMAAAIDGDACDTANGPLCQNFSKCVITSGTSGICMAQAGTSCGVSTGGTSSGGTSGGGTSGGTSSGGTSGGTVHTIALVDNDGYVGDSSGNDSPLLSAYQGYLTGAGIAASAYDLITVQFDGSQSTSPNTVPTSAQLTQYNTIVWFAADNDNSQGAGSDAPISSDQETILANWLSGGGKTLVVFSEYLISVDLSSTGGYWTTAPTNPLFTTYLPIKGGQDDPYLYPQDIGSGANDLTQGQTASFTFNGTATVSSAFGALQWTVGLSSLLVTNSYTADVVNPKTGVDILATLQSDPLLTGTANITTPVVIGKKNAGGSTSTVVYVGIEPVAIQALSGQGTAQQFVTGILQTYAGMP